MSVVVLYQGRRKTVKVRPMDPMQLVLQEAAQEFGVNAIGFALFSKKSPVDLAQPFRFTGLSNNALLELAPTKVPVSSAATNAPVQIALSTPHGSIQLTVPASSSLVDVVSQAVAAGQLPSEIRAQSFELVYLSQAYNGERLSQTLQDLGLAGQRARFILRVIAPDVNAQEQVPMHMTTHEESTTTAEALPIAATPADKHSTQPQVHPETSASTEQQERHPQQLSFQEQARSAQESQQQSLQEQRAEEKVPVVTAGIQGCRDAMQQLLSSSFQADATAAVLLLMRYLANILSDPSEIKFRSIKIGNSAFQTKLQPRPGASEFLAAIGFELEQRGLAHEVAQDPENRTFITLAVPPNEGQLQRQVALLKESFRVLAATCDELQIPPDERPRLTALSPSAGQQARNSQPAFDPFKSNIVRHAPQPRNTPQDMSVTDVRLNELQAKQEALQGQPENVERAACIYLPGFAYGQAEGEAEVESKAADMPENTTDDMRFAASYVAKSLAKAKAREDAPLQTKAMRDLARLQNQKVYARTAIKIQLPNRVTVQASFHPRETVGQIRDLLNSFLHPDVAATPMQLYIAPPRQILRDQDTLVDSNLVPAAVVYVSWSCDNTAPLESIFNSEGLALIQQQLPPADAEGVYPSGAPLVEQSSKRAADADAVRVSQSSSTQEAKPKSGKVPKWLKL